MHVKMHLKCTAQMCLRVNLLLCPAQTKGSFGVKSTYIQKLLFPCLYIFLMHVCLVTCKCSIYLFITTQRSQYFHYQCLQLPQLFFMHYHGSGFTSSTAMLTQKYSNGRCSILFVTRKKVKVYMGREKNKTKQGKLPAHFQTIQHIKKTNLFQLLRLTLEILVVYICKYVQTLCCVKALLINLAPKLTLYELPAMWDIHSNAQRERNLM